METDTPFVTLDTAQGSYIINQLDYDPEKPQHGISAELLRDGERFKGIGVLVLKMALHRRKLYGDGVVIIDGGANQGTFTVPWARFMKGWGEVIAFEPQDWPFRQLGGNTCKNNVLNTRIYRAALSDCCGMTRVPYIHPLVVHNSGGVHVGEGEPVPMVSVDSLHLPRLDILKLDVESMEPAALAGARETIARCKPFVVAEAALCGADKIMAALSDYAIVGAVDAVCIPVLPENQEWIASMVEFAKVMKL